MARKRSETAADGMEPKRDRRRLPKLIVTVTEDGKPDLSTLNEEARDKLRAALEEAAPEPPEPIQPAVVGFALAALARIEAAIVAPKFGLSAEQAADILLPKPPLKDSLEEAAARVLNKYSGAWFRYQDELVLGALLVSWQAGALQMLRAARGGQQPESGASPAPAQPSAPAAAAPAPAEQSDYPVMTERDEDFAYAGGSDRP